MKLHRTFPFVAAAALAAGFTLPAFAQNTGSANFSSFVAVGDSLASGFVSGGLLSTNQAGSVPALIFKQATGGTLRQPLASAPGIPALLELRSLTPVTIAPKAGVGAPIAPRPFQNLSVPGFRIGDSPKTVTGNPVINLVLQGQGTQLQQALAARPTFAVMWLGNNDVLAAATSGRVIEGVTLTPVASFRNDYLRVAAALRQAGANMVMATIPNVTSIPFVTTIPNVIVNPQTNQPVLGPNGAPIPLLGPGGVPLGSGDRVLLTASSALARGIGIPAALGGSGVGLGDDLVLSASEIATIQARADEYNRIIREVAIATGSALVELGPILVQAGQRGINVGGVNFTSAFVTGGVFSLDGVHPTPFGYAYLANEFITAINRTYGADIPLVDLFSYLFGPEATTATLAGFETPPFVFTSEAAQQVVKLFAGTPPSEPPPPKRGKGRRR